MAMDVLRLAVRPTGSCMEQDAPHAAQPDKPIRPDLLHAAFHELDQAMAILVLKDGRPRVVDANAAFNHLTGVTAGLAQDADFLALIPLRAENMRGIRELRLSLDSHRPLVTRLTFAAPDDACLELSLRPLAASAGSSFLCTLRAAQGGDAAIADRLLSFLSHDLRTPLNGILGFSEIMMTDFTGPLAPEDYRAYARDIHEAGQDLLHLVNGLLDICHDASGGLRIRDELFSLSDCLSSCLAAARAKAKAAGVTLRKSIARDLPAFRGDPGRMRQIVMIMLSSAIAASPRGGAVSFRARHDDTGLRLTCTGGRGTSAPGQLSRTWPGGWISYPSGNPQLSMGPGIGMPLLRVLVERHEGTVSVTRTRDGRNRISLHFPGHRMVPRG